mgnify:CR=1 FL=1
MKLGDKLHSRFSWLIGLSDDELRINNINQRVNLRDDQIYRHSPPEVRAKMMNRSLTEGDWENLVGSILAGQGTITVNLEGIDQESLLHHAAIATTSKGRYLGRDATDEQEDTFRREILRLISDGQTSITRIREQGLDPKLVQSRARNLVTSFKMAKVERIITLTKRVRRQHYRLVGKQPGDPSAD